MGNANIAATVAARVTTPGRSYRPCLATFRAFNPSTRLPSDARPFPPANDVTAIHVEVSGKCAVEAEETKVTRPVINKPQESSEAGHLVRRVETRVGSKVRISANHLDHPSPLVSQIQDLRAGHIPGCLGAEGLFFCCAECQR